VAGALLNGRGRLSQLFGRTGVRRAIDAAMGTVLVALGARLAAERR
jgi:hypothetical protein